MMSLSRRRFLKDASIAAAGLLASCGSPTETKTNGQPNELTRQNLAVNIAEVDKSLDAMALSLAQTVTAAEAWQTIIQKPAGKTWPQVKAAIKFNEVGLNRSRAALIDKICRELIALGMAAENIRLYGGRNQNGSEYTTLLKSAVPQGVGISQYGGLLGGTGPAVIPKAVKSSYEVTSAECVKEIADHTNDILVNIAVNKGHWDEYGGFTLCMKNHFGTFDPEPFRVYSGSFDISHGNFNYLLAINKADCLIGGSLPQQQLCIVDSLWAIAGTNMGARPDDTPLNRLVMGTFAPCVDILTDKEIRQKVQNTAAAANADQILPAFGYTASEIGEMKLVSVDAGNPSFTPTTYPAASVAPINPAIDNRRVVCCHNEKMVKT